MSFDISYFTKEKVTVDDLARIATGFGYIPFIPAPSSDRLHIVQITPDKDDTPWQYYQVEYHKEDLQYCDDEEKIDFNIVLDYATVSSFHIAYNSNLWPQMRVFWRRLFEVYGGWAGSSNDEWKPIYTLDNIENVPYPEY